MSKKGNEIGGRNVFKDIGVRNAYEDLSECHKRRGDRSSEIASASLLSFPWLRFIWRLM